MGHSYKLFLHSLTASKILKCRTPLEDAYEMPTDYPPNKVLQQVVQRGLLPGTLYSQHD